MKNLQYLCQLLILEWLNLSEDEVGVVAMAMTTEEEAGVDTLLLHHHLVVIGEGSFKP